MALVVIVVLVFLQGWRPTIIPSVAIPVSLVGTFAAMAALGYGIKQSHAVRPCARGRHRSR
jgi:multidrug efflux pump subunit AcrB